MDLASYLAAAPQRTRESVFDVVRAVASQFPLKTAVVGDSELTYGALIENALKVATLLPAAGAAPGQVVGFASSRSALAPEVVLGIFAAGCVYLPLDPLYPDPMLERMLGAARPSLVLVDREASGRVPPVPDIPVIDVAAVRSTWPSQGAVRISGDAAYIVFTSGTTGEPRGVLLGHDGLAHYVSALASRVGTTAVDRCLGGAPLGFSASIRQILAPLTVGAQVVVPSDEDLSAPWQFLELLKERRVTQLDIVPSLWRAILDAEERDEVYRHTLSLRRALFASEALDHDLLRRTVDSGPEDITVWNMYGCTETTGIVTAFDATSTSESGEPLPIGSALDHVRVGLRRGAEGDELEVEGDAVALAYIHPDGKVEELLETKRGVRTFPTGDVAREAPPGTFSWVGRCTRQSKVRGFRVSHDAVEALLLRSELVRRASVASASDAGLVVAVQPARTSITADDIRQWMRSHLPAHMAPARVLILAEFPTRPNSKTDHRQVQRVVDAIA